MFLETGSQELLEQTGAVCLWLPLGERSSGVAQAPRFQAVEVSKRLEVANRFALDLVDDDLLVRLLGAVPGPTPRWACV